MKEVLGLVAVALSIIGHAPYIKDTINKKTKPHVFTWLVWSIVTTLAFLAQWVKGGGAGSWTTGVTGVITIIIMLLALKNGTKDIKTIDKIFFAGALLAIIPWYLTKDPTLSVIMITTIDVLAFFPTIRKTINDPTSETFFMYALNLFRHSISILALATYNISTVLFPAAILVMNGVMTAIMLRPKYKK